MQYIYYLLGQLKIYFFRFKEDIFTPYNHNRTIPSKSHFSNLFLYNYFLEREMMSFWFVSFFDLYFLLLALDQKLLRRTRSRRCCRKCSRSPFSRWIATGPSRLCIACMRKILAKKLPESSNNLPALRHLRLNLEPCSRQKPN